jgi:hypothetical protein
MKSMISAIPALPILHLLSQMDLLLIAGWKAVSWVLLNEMWQSQSLANLNMICRVLCNQVCHEFLKNCFKGQLQLLHA